jgi:hypothetical protein
MLSEQSAKRAREVAGPRFNQRVSARVPAAAGAAFSSCRSPKRLALTLFPTCPQPRTTERSP